MIFSRRAIQERLFALEHVLDAKSHHDIINRLEHIGSDRLSTMWEVVWLAALSAVSPLEHEVPLANGSRPDFRLSLTVGENRFEVIGDITAPSDKGLHENNPINQFREEIVRLARKHKLNPNHFRYDVGNRSVGKFGDSRTVLLLPPRSDLRVFMKKHVEPFINGLARTPVTAAVFPYSSHDIAFTISYNQAQRFGGGGYASYAVPYSPTKNPIFTALDKKARQLGGAPSDALRVVIMCDAGCHAMQNSMLTGGGGFTASQVVTKFLQKTTSIDVVLLVGIETVNPMEHRRRFQQINATLVVPPEHSRRPRLTPSAIVAIRDLLNQSIKRLPKPMMDAKNASIRCDMQGYGLALHGAFKMSGNKIRISSRLVLELLSGKTSYDEFERLHGWSPASERGQPNPLTLALKRGSMIDTVTVIPSGDDDDDWLEFDLRDADPAITPFKRSGGT